MDVRLLPTAMMLAISRASPATITAVTLSMVTTRNADISIFASVSSTPATTKERRCETQIRANCFVGILNDGCRFYRR